MWWGWYSRFFPQCIPMLLQPCIIFQIICKTLFLWIVFAFYNIVFHEMITIIQYVIKLLFDFLKPSVPLSGFAVLKEVFTV